MNELRTKHVPDAAATGEVGRHGVAVGLASRPTNFVAGVLPDIEATRLAISELIAAGIPEVEIAVLQGESGAAVIAAGRQAARPLDLGDEDTYVGWFEEESRAGHFVLGVPLTGRGELRSHVRSILGRHGGHSMVSRSRWTYEWPADPWPSQQSVGGAAQ